jgi:flavodoxin
MMNLKNIFLLSTMVINALISAHSSAQHATRGDNAAAGIGKFSGKKVLIVYLTRTGNTQAIAQSIQKNAGGKLVSLELSNPYPQDYKAQVAQVVRENEKSFLPALKTKIDSIEKYDVVFVGFPTWDMNMPPPMKTFLNQYNLSGKTVIPFNTNAGYGVGSGFQTVKELCPKSRVLDGFSIQGGIERDGILFVMKGKKAEEAETGVKNWLKALSID